MIDDLFYGNLLRRQQKEIKTLINKNSKIFFDSMKFHPQSMLDFSTQSKAQNKFNILAFYFHLELSFP